MPTWLLGVLWYIYIELGPWAACRWDVLVWVEGIIYELDETNEQLARQGITCMSAAGLEAFQALQVILRDQGLHTEAVRAELAAGLEYWEGERRLAQAMLEHPAIPPSGHAIFSLEDVHATSRLKSFDYRVSSEEPLDFFLFAG